MVNYLTGNVEYFEGDGFLVIGAAHVHKLPEGKIPEFVEKVSDLAGMKAEAVEQMPEGIPHNCIEVLAKAAMIGKPFEPFAETRQNGDILEKVMQEYGMPIEITEMYLACSPFAYTDMIGKDPVKLAFRTMQALLHQKEIRFPSIDTHRTVENFKKVYLAMRESEFGPKGITSFTEAYAMYYKQIREFEILFPDLRAFRERTEGKIGALVGKLHAKPAAAMLSGEEMERPMDWGVYKLGGMSLEDMAVLSVLELILFEE